MAKAAAKQRPRFIMVIINKDELINIKDGYFLTSHWNFSWSVPVGRVMTSPVRISEIAKFKDKSFIWDNRRVHLHSIIMEIVFYTTMHIPTIRKKYWSILSVELFERFPVWSNNELKIFIIVFKLHLKIKCWITCRR